MGWVSYLNRAATTNYLCCGQALEDSLGAGRIGLTHNFGKVTMFFFNLQIKPGFYLQIIVCYYSCERSTE